MSPGRGLPLVHEVLALHGRHLADKPALVDDRQTVTYADLLAGAERLADTFTDHGIRPGARVGLALDPSPAHVAAIVALWRLGAVAAPLNVLQSADDLAAYASRIGIDQVLVDDAHADRAGIAPHALHLPGAGSRFADATAAGPRRTAHDGPAATPPMSADGMAPAMAFPTGGTTGAPKGALWSAAGIAGVVSSNCVHIDVRRHDCELYLSPFFHVSLITGLFAPLFAGATVRLATPFDAGTVARLIATGEITRLFAVPAALERLMAGSSAGQPAEGADRVRVVVFGASGSVGDFVERLSATFPRADIYTGYGASEFGPVTRAYPDEIQGGVDFGVGRPVAGAQVRVVGPDGAEVPDGVVGEIVVDVPWKMLGYLGSEEDPWTADGAVRTGDLAEIHDGYVKLRGRSKELIKSGGEQVFPVDVERVLDRHPAVAAAAVYGVPDDRWGERVECAVVPAAGTTVDAEDLRRFCREQLAGFQVPKRVVVVDELPRTANLKLDRRALVEAATDA